MKRVYLSEIKQLPHLLIEKLSQILREDLMFDSNAPLPTLEEVKQFNDRQDNMQCGYYFGAEGILPGRLWDYTRIVAAGARKAVLPAGIFKRDDPTIPYGPVSFASSAYSMYRSRCDRFLRVLLVAIISVVGVPPRITEVIPLQYANTATQERSVILEDGAVLLVMYYNKTNANSGKLICIIRRLPFNLGRLLVTYLTACIGFQASLECILK